MPVTPVLSEANLLVNKKASWMVEGMHGGGWYDNRKQTLLGGLGPAIAQINTFFYGHLWTTLWKVPFAEVCDEIVGNYSITNFPPHSNSWFSPFLPCSYGIQVEDS